MVLLSILILLTLVGAIEANISITLTDLNVAVETPSITDDGSKIAFDAADAAELYNMADIYVVSYDGSSSEPAPDLESNNDENYVYLVVLALGIIFVIVLAMVFIRRKNLILGVKF